MKNFARIMILIYVIIVITLLSLPYDGKDTHETRFVFIIIGGFFTTISLIVRKLFED